MWIWMRRHDRCIALMRMLFSVSLCHVLPTAAAIACPGQVGKVIFEDDFSDDSGGWQLDNVYTEVKDHSLLLRPNAKGANDEWSAVASANLTFSAGEGDFCTELVLPKAPAQDNAVGAGVFFWSTDAQNMFSLYITTDKDVRFSKLVNNNWTRIFTDENDAAIKLEPGAVNSIRVVVKDARVTMFVNGAQVKVIRAAQPTNATGFGVRAQVDKATDAKPAIEFKSFKVTAGQ
jgi:hypothetical protein